MDGLEAIETINSWRRVLIEGKREDIDSMLSDVERRLGEKGWQRATDREAAMGRSGNGKESWRCFVGGPPGGPKLLLCLTRVSDRRVRGGTYSLISAPPGMQPSDVAKVVEDVVTIDLTPSASTFQLRVTTPRLGRMSRVPPKTLAALRFFSDMAAGVWPLPAQCEQAWRHFVISACLEDAAFDIEELSDWFVANGWTAEAADVLKKRFVSEAGLISEYVDVGASGQ